MRVRNLDITNAFEPQITKRNLKYRIWIRILHIHTNLDLIILQHQIWEVWDLSGNHGSGGELVYLGTFLPLTSIFIYIKIVAFHPNSLAFYLFILWLRRLFIIVYVWDWKCESGLGEIEIELADCGGKSMCGVDTVCGGTWDSDLRLCVLFRWSTKLSG